MSPLYCKNIRTSVITTDPSSTEVSTGISLEKYVLIYYDWLKVDCHFPPGKSQYNHFMRTLCDVLKENSDDFIALNVNVFDFVFHLSPKMLPYCSYMVAKWHLPSPAFYYINCGYSIFEYILSTI